MKAWMTSVLCWLGWHSLDRAITDYMRGGIYRNWFSDGRTSYWTRSCTCADCDKPFVHSWSYDTPYEEWAFGGKSVFKDWNGETRQLGLVPFDSYYRTKE